MKRLLSVWIALTLVPVVGLAQPPRGRPQDQNFVETSPKIGEMVPDVKAFDAKGKEISLHQFKGSHTILVFGCLT